MNSQPDSQDKTHNDPLLNKIVRNSFRVPVDDADDMWVLIDGTRYPIRDICLDGIGIITEDPSAFTVAQIFMDCELNLAGELITGLNGRVIHFSLNSGKDWQSGIQWIAMTDDARKKITDIVTELKQEFLIDDHSTD